MEDPWDHADNSKSLEMLWFLNSRMGVKMTLEAHLILTLSLSRVASFSFLAHALRVKAALTKNLLLNPSAIDSDSIEPLSVLRSKLKFEW